MASTSNTSCRPVIRAVDQQYELTRKTCPGVIFRQRRTEPPSVPRFRASCTTPVRFLRPIWIRSPAGNQHLSTPSRRALWVLPICLRCLLSHQQGQHHSGQHLPRLFSASCGLSGISRVPARFRGFHRVGCTFTHWGIAAP